MVETGQAWFRNQVCTQNRESTSSNLFFGIRLRSGFSQSRQIKTALGLPIILRALVVGRRLDGIGSYLAFLHTVRRAPVTPGGTVCLR